MPERQAGTGVVAFFGVIRIERLLAPLGVGQWAAVDTLDVRHIRPGPDAVQVEHSPGSFGCGAFERLKSATTFARARPAFTGALTGSRSTGGRTRGLLRNQSGTGQRHGCSEHQAL